MVSEAPTPTPAPRPRRARLIVAGVAVVALLGGAAAAAIVLPQFFGSNLSDETEVADILSEPQLTWTYDWVGENDREFLDETPQATEIGDGRALVWASFDYAAFLDKNGASGWYEGYDEQYDAGFDLGEQYADDVQEYNADTYPYTVPAPHEEDYFPEGAYDNYVEFLGFQHGFADGRAGKTIGTSREEAPPTPNFTPAVTALDTTNGAVLWTVNLAELVEGVDYSSTYYAQEVEGSNAVALFISTYSALDVGYSVLVLDTSSGAVLSQLSTDAPVSGESLDGDLVLALSDDTGESSRVARYSPSGLAGDPKWSTDVDGSAYLTVGEGYVIVQGSEQGTVLNGSNGTAAGWGQDISYTVGYAFVGSQLIRIQTTESAENYRVEGWTTKGTSSWSAPITVSYFELTDAALFSSEASEGGYSALQRVDPATGDSAWQQPFGETFDRTLGVQGNRVLLQRGDTVIVLDLGSGEEAFRESPGEFTVAYEGSSLYYVLVEGALNAYKYSGPGEVWSFALSDAQRVTVAGGRLAIVDFEAGTLSGLAG